MIQAEQLSYLQSYVELFTYRITHSGYSEYQTRYYRMDQNPYSDRKI